MEELKKDNFTSTWIGSGSASASGQKSRYEYALRNHQNTPSAKTGADPKGLPETHLLIDGDGTLPLLLPDAGKLLRRFPSLIRPRLRNRQPHLL